MCLPFKHYDQALYLQSNQHLEIETKVICPLQNTLEYHFDVAMDLQNFEIQ